MKFKLASLGLCIALTAFGYTATPSEFPSTFIKQAQQVVDHAVEEVKDQSDLHAIISPIAGMDNYASLKTVRRQLAELEQLTMSDSLNTHIDAMRLAGLFKLSVPLILRLNDRILDALSDIEHLIFFWKEAHEYRVQFFLHRKSPKVIVNELQLIQQELCTLLGSLVQLVNRAPFGQDHARQYAWFDDMYGLFHMQKSSESSASVSLVFETVAAMLTRATNFVLGFSAQMDKRLYEYSKPSWVRRHLGSAVTTLVGGTAAAVSAHQCKDAHGDRYVEKVAENIGRHATMYRDACADALYGNDNRRNEELEREERSQILEFKTKASQLLPAFTRNATERDAFAEQLVRQRLLDLGVISDGNDFVNLSHVQFDENNKPFLRPFHAATDDDIPSLATPRASRRRSASDADASAAAAAASTRMTDLERVYCKLFGMKSMPEPKECAAQLLDRGSSFFTVDAMNQAAEKRDLWYFFPLITQPVSVEGIDLARGVANIPVVLGDTEMNEAHLIRAVLAEATDGTRVRHFLPGAPEQPTTKRYKTPGAGVAAIAEGMKGKLNVLETMAQLPDIGRFMQQIGYTKLERTKFELWKKTKLLVMIGIGYFLYRVGKDMLVPPIRYLLKKTKILAYPHEELFETLRELKKLLLVNGERQQSEMEPCDLGLLYYLIYRLECVDVPAKYSASFLNDVRLLQSPDLSAKQKYKVVKDVLQNGYPFLRHTAVKTK